MSLSRDRAFVACQVYGPTRGNGSIAFSAEPSEIWGAGTWHLRQDYFYAVTERLADVVNELQNSADRMAPVR